MLISVACQHMFFCGHILKKCETVDASGRDLVGVNGLSAADELAEIIPVKGSFIYKFGHQRRRVEGITNLPKLEYYQTADQWLIKGSGGKHTEIIDIACLVALMARADFFSDNLWQHQAGDVHRRKRQMPKVALVALLTPIRGECRGLPPADLELDLAVAARVPVMHVNRIDTPRKTVLRLVVAVIGNAEPNAVKRLLEGCHHGEDNVFVVVLLKACKVQIG